MLIESAHTELSIVQQCNLLGICRSGLYYISKGKANSDELEVKEEIDKTYTKMPYYGIRRMTAQLCNKGFTISEKRVRKYYREMRISAIYPRPKCI